MIQRDALSCTGQKKHSTWGDHRNACLVRGRPCLSPSPCLQEPILGPLRALRVEMQVSAGQSSAPSEVRCDGARGHVCPALGLPEVCALWRDTWSSVSCRRHMETSHSATSSDWKTKPGNPGLQRRLKVSSVPLVLAFSWMALVSRHLCLQPWGRSLGHLARGPVYVAVHVAALGASQRQFCSKRPEHCDLELFGSGKADVKGNAVGECAFCFLPGERQTESCGKYFAQTHRVPSLELANLQLLHELCTPWTSFSLSLPFVPSCPGGSSPHLLVGALGLGGSVAGVLLQGEEEQRAKRYLREPPAWAGALSTGTAVGLGSSVLLLSHVWRLHLSAAAQAPPFPSS